ncbi:unnamed protein product, partial [Mesorhabditis spiculigera]
MLRLAVLLALFNLISVAWAGQIYLDPTKPTTTTAEPTTPSLTRRFLAQVPLIGEIQKNSGPALAIWLILLIIFLVFYIPASILYFVRRYRRERDGTSRSPTSNGRLEELEELKFVDEGNGRAKNGNGRHV